jgi:hypothetical protein
MEAHAKIEETVDNIKDYINTRYELVGLQASEKVSGIMSNVISGFMILVVIMLSVVLLSFSAAWYLSSVIGHRYSGFLLIGGLYLVLGIVMIFLKDKILFRPFRDIIIGQIYKEEENVKA